MLLPVPAAGEPDVRSWVADHLGDLTTQAAKPVDPPLRGGQTSADAALWAFDVAGYARRRNEVWPPQRRGASGLSPYIRHGLLTLREVWDHVGSGPPRDTAKFRDELRWQEYARHLYARVGDASAESLRYNVVERSEPVGDPWVSEAKCLDLCWEELAGGWLTNQTRMWLASHWTVRENHGWRDGEDLMFRHLLDGSRAANRLGWQWTVGALTGKAYGFSRWQVEKRAPGLCTTCPLERHCPIEHWPTVSEREPRAMPNPHLRRDDDPESTAGPSTPRHTAEAEAVWMTAESLSDRDPAAASHPELPVIFVFDEPLLRRLQLSVNRLAFLAESLADLATRREVRVHRGDPVEVLQGIALATTFAPVPGWRRRAARLDVAALHPWPWLERPRSGPVGSFTAWAGSARPARRGGTRTRR
ncbi:FAD-binding domain-containing protein [Mycolicibacterium grossiae]|uniref:Deoxyribodipyrimidine photolyase n=1 Tax=Mycolicibacterium grossiae TaxID=1552759 RepID=A0A1E8PYU5_9MYCO|nr:FAD-binding domain-containing protein [Mycolicibacterium grossiae]OFJ51020.1 deoxyribodipyrimidine photolyase [Mycolicibacterium grossiae]QEM44516.1 deoxyribodipyrimidine photolyase [Mycolicibacterium grossiae]